jgi:hypothetical protein
MTEPKRGRTINVGIRLTPEELEAIRREAVRRGWSISQVMRRRCLKGLDVQAVPAGDEQRKAVG